MRYVNVYWFNVIDTLKDGKEVFCIDKEHHEVLCVATLPVKTLVSILTVCEEKESFDRFEFYYIAEEGEKNGNL